MLRCRRTRGASLWFVRRCTHCGVRQRCGRWVTCEYVLVQNLLLPGLRPLWWPPGADGLGTVQSRAPALRRGAGGIFAAAAAAIRRRTPEGLPSAQRRRVVSFALPRTLISSRPLQCWTSLLAQTAGDAARVSTAVRSVSLGGHGRRCGSRQCRLRSSAPGAHQGAWRPYGTASIWLVLRRSTLSWRPTPGSHEILGDGFSRQERVVLCIGSIVAPLSLAATFTRCSS